MFGAFVGATAGVFIRCWANALGKQRYLARKFSLPDSIVIAILSLVL